MSGTTKMANDETKSQSWEECFEKLFVAIDANDSAEAERLLVEVDEAWLGCFAGMDETELRQRLHQTFDTEFMARVRGRAKGKLRRSSATLSLCMIEHLCNVVRIMHEVSV